MSGQQKPRHRNKGEPQMRYSLSFSKCYLSQLVLSAASSRWQCPQTSGQPLARWGPALAGPEHMQQAYKTKNQHLSRRKSHGQRSLVGYTVHGVAKESDTTWQVNNNSKFMYRLYLKFLSELTHSTSQQLYIISNIIILGMRQPQGLCTCSFLSKKHQLHARLILYIIQTSDQISSSKRRLF